jgi:hypothetical protein
MSVNRVGVAPGFSGKLGIGIDSYTWCKFDGFRRRCSEAGRLAGIVYDGPGGALRLNDEVFLCFGPLSRYLEHPVKLHQSSIHFVRSRGTEAIPKAVLKSLYEIFEFRAFKCHLLSVGPTLDGRTAALRLLADQAQPCRSSCAGAH